MEPCSAENFYEPYGPMRDIYLQALPFAMCLPKAEEISLFGNSYTENLRGLDIRLKRCTNKPTCKNETEINDFIDNHGQFQIFYNRVSYQTENYSPQVLEKFLFNKNWPIRSTDNWIQTFYLRKSFLESEERYLGDGFFPRVENWIEVIEQ